MCQFRSKIVKLEDDLRISGGTSKVASMGSQSKALELTSQITQLTQENVIAIMYFINIGVRDLLFFC